MCHVVVSIQPCAAAVHLAFWTAPHTYPMGRDSRSIYLYLSIYLSLYSHVPHFLSSPPQSLAPRRLPSTRCSAKRTSSSLYRGKKHAHRCSSERTCVYSHAWRACVCMCARVCVCRCMQPSCKLDSMPPHDHRSYRLLTHRASSPLLSLHFFLFLFLFLSLSLSLSLSLALSIGTRDG